MEIVYGKKIRILLTLSEFMFGSKVRQVCDLVAGLDKSIFDVEIAGITVGDEATEEIRSLGVPLYQLRLLPSRTVNIYKLKEFIRSPFIVKSKQYDIVHSLCYQSICTDAFIIKYFSDARYVYTKTNLEWERHRLNWHLKTWAADKVISISRATDDLLGQKGFANKIRKIFLGIDMNYFTNVLAARHSLRASLSIPPKSMVFGCAAQFVEWKGHLILIEAFETLAQYNKNIFLVLCGPNHSDEYYKAVIKRIQSSNAKDRILLLGTIADMQAFYSAIDCFVLPSRNEPFGYVYIEALSCEKPVIACPAGGALDIVEENINGLFAKTDSSIDLANKMKQYMENPDKLIEHGKFGRKIVSKFFSKEKMVKEHQELYLELSADT